MVKFLQKYGGLYVDTERIVLGLDYLFMDEGGMLAVGGDDDGTGIYVRCSDGVVLVATAYPDSVAGRKVASPSIWHFVLALIESAEQPEGD